jgi:DNA oxidative demethylase
VERNQPRVDRQQSLIANIAYHLAMLFANAPLKLAPGVYLLKGFVDTLPLRSEIESIAKQAAFRHFAVRGGKSMSVAMTNCGRLGWVSDEQGYAYAALDPISGLAWPAMPPVFQSLSVRAAEAVGWRDFEPDACLINRYTSGSGMGLHQDRNEIDLTAPIVSVSIGASCRFMLGGMQRTDHVKSFELHDGDVLVWGGASRLVFHGVRPMPANAEQLRYNLTFRKAG